MRNKSDCRNRILLVIGISLIFLLTFSSSSNPGLIAKNKALDSSKTYSFSDTPHAPISITSDDDFKKLGFEGNGSKVNPYLIRDLSISVDHDGEICISIVSTSVYFVIQNCELYSVDTDKAGIGIYMEKVANGAVLDSNIHSLDVGIFVYKSRASAFINNTLSGLGKGFYLSQSFWLTIANNYVTSSDFGMHLYKIDYSVLVRNYIDDCDNGVLIENGVEILTQSNEVKGSFFGLYFHNTYKCDSFSNLIHDSRYGVYFAYSQECNISSSELVNNKHGISLLEVEKGVISSNFVKSNAEYGIHLKNSRDIKILSNLVFENAGVGVYLIGVFGASIHYNEIGFNTIGNAADFTGAVPKSLLNNWDTNAWSDYKGTVNYAISGDRGSFDNDPHYIIYVNSPPDIILEAPASGVINWYASALKPNNYSISMDGVLIAESLWDIEDISANFTALDPGSYTFNLTVSIQSGRALSDVVIVQVIDSTPPEWVQVPEDQIVECGNSMSYQLEASDFYDIASWWVNNTDFSIDNGLLQNSVVLQYGIYHLEVRAYDPSDNYISQKLRVIVIDSFSPSVDSPSDIVFFEGEEGHVITWNVSDCNPSSYEILMDGISVESGQWTSDIDFIQYSLDGLASGTYVFSIILTDVAGNTNSDEVQVTIEEPSVTETSPSTTEPSETGTQTSTESPTPTDDETAGIDILTLGMIGVGAGVAIVLVLIVLKRK